MRFFIFLLSLFVLPVSLIAAEQSPAEIDSRYTYIHSYYKVNKDATHVETHEWARKILTERALKYAKQTSISYSKSVQKAEILEAYTLKANGKRIDAPKTNYQVRENSGRNKNDPVFSDRVNISVVFADVDVGDTVVFSYKITQTEGLFPGHFNQSGFFSRSFPYDDVKITFDLPEGFAARYVQHDMKEKVVEKNGRKILSLSFSNSHPFEDKRRNYSVWNPESQPGYIIATFKSFKQIAETYGERATPKAKVTPKVTKLADEIVGKVKDKREQARLLYEWVSKNITYAGNCIGVGAVVPHDLTFILENKMGDCKDHATLLQALLNAKGIKNTQALVNSGSVYELPSLPNVSSVNHVMNYLPEFKIFADATSKDTPFGMLALSTQNKPVLLVDNYRKGFKTPVDAQNTNQQYMKTTVRIQKDGSASGDIELKLKGRFAVAQRAGLRNVTKKQEDEWIKNIFSHDGHIGSGSLEKEDPRALIDTYSFKVKFNTKEFILRPGAGAFYVTPLFPNQAPVYSFIASSVSPLPKVDVFCGNGISIEEYKYIFPAGIKLLSVPDDLNIDGKYLKYKASYKLDGNILTVKRRADDLSPVNICSPGVLKSQRRVGLKAIQNLKSQVIYK